MAFNINEITATINKSGVARADFFDVIFSGIPTSLGINRELSLRAESVTLPQRSVQPLDYKDYGVPFKIGGLANYVEIDMTFLLSEDLREREFFMKWQDLIVGNHRTRNQLSRGSQFDIGYFNTYKCDGIQINHYSGKESEEAPKHTIKLIDAYPLQIATISRSWAQPEFMRQQVTFTYRYFTEFAYTDE